MLRKWATLLPLLALLANNIFGQIGEVRASKDDWEEINFEFNSAVLSDGFPSLLRLAELLQKNPGYRVNVVGHTDVIGRNNYNQKLGLQRADSVKRFLVKYGASEGQITTESRASAEPKIEGQKRRYSKTDVPRWMARRVTFTVTGEGGARVGPYDGGINDAIKAVDPNAMMKKCCDDILARLDRLEQLLSSRLNDLEGGLKQARSDIDNVRGQVQTLPKKDDVTSIVNTETTRIVPEQLEKFRDRRFSVLGANIGADDTGNMYGNARGRLFMPFKDRFAVQLEGEYQYFRQRQEGQADIGLVNRIGRVQIGGFASFKYVNFRQFQNGGVLGQAAITADYLFRGGRIGGFGTKAFMQNAVLGRTPVGGSNNIFTETYLRVADQWGLSGQSRFLGPTWLEGNLAFIKTGNNDNRIGFTTRLVLPVADRFAFTVEGGMNEGLVARQSYTRIAAGFKMGNLIRPENNVDINHPVPVDIPRVRYELLTRTVRTGNGAPVADAGGDQVGVNAGTVTLDASASFDPDGDPITFQWTQIAGPTVTLANANTARPTFTAAAGQSYAFRVTVRDALGAQAIARTTVSTTNPQAPNVVRFAATPPSIQAGQTSTLTYQVQGATRVSISGIGDVNPSGGSISVSPAQTTTYTLTATNAAGTITDNVTVTVQQQAQGITINFSGQPLNIAPGETATLNWNVQGANQVTISGIGTVNPTGSVQVQPTTTTSYVLNATNGTNTASAVVTITVQQNIGPRILLFAALPTQIQPGQSTTLTWGTEGADTVTISGIGTVGRTGSQQVSPLQTTTYTLTATGGGRTTTATVTVVVPGGGPVSITNCRAEPPAIGAPPEETELKWDVQNAASVVITGIGPVQTGGGFVVRPLNTTTYTIVATGFSGDTASCNVTVPVGTATGAPTVTIQGAPIISTDQRTVTLTATAANVGSGGVTYTWRSLFPRSGQLNSNSGQTVTATIIGPAGDTQFSVTATNAAGQSSTAYVTVRFTRPNDQIAP